MLDLESMDFHPTSKKIVKILRKKTQNTESDLYYHVLTGFFFSQMATSMRVTINTEDRGKLPVNMYACNLGTSGMGKGHSMNIMENEIVNQFKSIFTKYTFPAIAEDSLQSEANQIAIIKQTDPAEELEALNKEFRSYGAMPYSFDSGTSAAFKQVRTKAQMAKAGALNFICDEIGTNLLANQEIFSVGLEAYDVGKIKQKITKNTAENARAEERDDPVPTNMLIFGTPAKLFNGGKEEQEYRAMLDTGYARRFIFGVGSKTKVSSTLSPEEIFNMLTDKSVDTDVIDLSNYFGRLADRINYESDIIVPRDVSIEIIKYRLMCENIAEGYPEHEEIQKAEMCHRYFKAMKLAGAYAFIDNVDEMTIDHLHNAIALVEASGKAFRDILNRDKPFVRLAKYISEVGEEVTHADLTEALPFFRGTNAQKNEMIQLATGWGYKNNIVIKRYFSEGIEFLKGESLQETDLNSLILSCALHEAYGFAAKTIAFNKLDKMTSHPGLHWCNHTFINEHRKEDNAQDGFNMIVLDVDDGTPLASAKELLQDYTCMFYTTKRHTEELNRYRIIIPIKYHLKLNAKDYKEFMNNVFDWLPFSVDEGTDQRSKKWLSHKGTFVYNTGEILDPMKFIPKTSKNESMKKDIQSLGSMDNIERWFANQMGSGQRNNTMIKFALLLQDGGMPPDEVEEKVVAFNNKLKDKLPLEELNQTVLTTMWKRAKET